MNKLTVFLLLNLTLFFGGAQCWDARDESIEKVLRHYQNSHFDSINYVLSDWKLKCEMNEELVRLSILNAIQQGRTVDSLLDKHTIGFFRSFETRQMESMLPYFHVLRIQAQNFLMTWIG